MDRPPNRTRLRRQDTRRPTMYEPMGRNTPSSRTHYPRDEEGKRLAPLSQLNTRVGRGLASSHSLTETYFHSSSARTLGRKLSDRGLLSSQRRRRNESNSTCSAQSLARSPSTNSGSLKRRPSVRRSGSSHVLSLPQRCDSPAPVVVLRSVSVVRRTPISQRNARRFSFDYGPEIMSVVTRQRDDTGASVDCSSGVKEYPSPMEAHNRTKPRAQGTCRPP
jgi:hypothetical protein